MKQTLTFDRDTTSVTIPVTIINDEIHEADEEFLGQLIADDVVMLSNSLTTIQILDDDG